MLLVLQLIAVMFVALAMAMAVAHALELPGKMRLDKQTCHAVSRSITPGRAAFGMIGLAASVLAVAYRR